MGQRTIETDGVKDGLKDKGRGADRGRRRGADRGRRGADRGRSQRTDLIAIHVATSLHSDS